MVQEQDLNELYENGYYRYRNRIAEISKELLNGAEFHIRIKDGSGVRSGSIGKIVLPNYAYEAKESFDEFSKKTSGINLSQRYQEYEINYYFKFLWNCKLDFGKNKPLEIPAVEHLVLLENYTGPLKYVYDRNLSQKNTIVKEPFCDFMNHEINIDDVVSVVDDKTIIVGVVTRLSETGLTVYVKPVKVSDSTFRRKEISCTRKDRIMKIDAGLMDRILIARLSN